MKTIIGSKYCFASETLVARISQHFLDGLGLFRSKLNYNLSSSPWQLRNQNSRPNVLVSYFNISHLCPRKFIFKRSIRGWLIVRFFHIEQESKSKRIVSSLNKKCRIKLCDVIVKTFDKWNASVVPSLIVRWKYMNKIVIS